MWQLSYGSHPSYQGQQDLSKEFSVGQLTGKAYTPLFIKYRTARSIAICAQSWSLVFVRVLRWCICEEHIWHYSASTSSCCMVIALHLNVESVMSHGHQRLFSTILLYWMSRMPAAQINGTRGREHQTSTMRR